ncbi:hypothetical protein HDU91_004092, partial [Kappamyces sp. JEL0680]
MEELNLHIEKLGERISLLENLLTSLVNQMSRLESSIKESDQTVRLERTGAEKFRKRSPSVLSA